MVFVEKTTTTQVSQKPISQSIAKQATKPRRIGITERASINVNLNDIERRWFPFDKSYRLEVLFKHSESVALEGVALQNSNRLHLMG